MYEREIKVKDQGQIVYVIQTSLSLSSDLDIEVKQVVFQ